MLPNPPGAPGGRLGRSRSPCSRSRSLVWPFPAPLGVIVNGALVGSRVALIALGIALVYRANRVINFAAGDLGQLPASLAVLLVLSLGLELRRSAPSSAWSRRSSLGVLVETLIIRRFYKSPRLIVTVATIGVAQVLTGAALFLPDLVRRPHDRRPAPGPAVRR